MGGRSMMIRREGEEANAQSHYSRIMPNLIVLLLPDCYQILESTWTLLLIGAFLLICGSVHVDFLTQQQGHHKEIDNTPHGKVCTCLLLRDVLANRWVDEMMDKNRLRARSSTY